MERVAILFILVGLLLPSAKVAAAPINLSTWGQEGPLDDGNWVVTNGGDKVTQTINGGPTFFVSPGEFINSTFNGKFRVATSADDDYMGFVFGYQSPIGNPVDNMEFLLFDWKQSQQFFGATTAPEGFTLSRVNGTFDTDAFNGQLDDPFWHHYFNGVPHVAGFDVLASDWGSTRGWADNTEYGFSLLFQENRIKIDIKGGAFGAGETIFDIGGSFQGGKFGFYNNSLGQVVYEGFTEDAAPVPEPSTVLLLASGLVGLVVARRRR